MNLALGTAQFGLKYGVANVGEQITIREGRRILATGAEHGMNTLDTAADYGESENCLGEIGVENFKVITKLPSQINITVPITEWVRKSIYSSLSKLRLSSIYAIMLHKSDQLKGNQSDKLFNELKNIKKEGLIQKIGLSIYDPQELDFLKYLVDIDIIQAPLNVIDRRIINSGWLEKLIGMGKVVHTRSVFLQGLLLMPTKKHPNYFKPWTKNFEKWDKWLVDNGRDALSTCFSAVNLPEVDTVLVGADNVTQIKQIIKASKNLTNSVFPAIFDPDKCLVDPRNWKIDD
jgi:aryl-alcohol dehydrogenase-like predicted oxidoreductase